jgi:hypothetical protein
MHKANKAYHRTAFMEQDDSGHWNDRRLLGDMRSDVSSLAMPEKLRSPLNPRTSLVSSTQERVTYHNVEEWMATAKMGSTHKYLEDKNCHCSVQICLLAHSWPNTWQPRILKVMEVQGKKRVLMFSSVLN